ncbi:hypothetical protein CBA19CS11_35180 [Caballeronia novacaledonica]|nr:hypothetical protein CBA19CS11_35180 [Caballeronia novacaledonica]
MKIDRQFIARIDMQGAGLIARIVALIRHFGLQVTTGRVKGIEGTLHPTSFNEPTAMTN